MLTAWLSISKPCIGGNIVIWGIVLMLHATASSFSAFFALRFLLGVSLFSSTVATSNIGSRHV